MAFFRPSWASEMTSCTPDRPRRRSDRRKIGAALHQRTEERTNQRNGQRPRVLSTPAGDVELGIPRCGSGRSSRRCWSRGAGVDQALWAVVMKAYVHGVSTRKVDDLVRALGVDSGISSRR